MEVETYKGTHATYRTITKETLETLIKLKLEYDRKQNVVSVIVKSEGNEPKLFVVEEAAYGQ